MATTTTTTPAATPSSSSSSSQRLPIHKRKQQQTHESASITEDNNGGNKRLKTTTTTNAPSKQEDIKNKILRGIPFHPTMKEYSNGSPDLLCSVFENIDPPPPSSSSSSSSSSSTFINKEKGGGGGENAKRVAAFAYEAVKVMYPDLDEDIEKMFEMCKSGDDNKTERVVPESQLGRDLCILVALATIPPFRERLRPYCRPEWFEPFCDRIGHLVYIYMYGHNVKSSKPGRIKGCMPSYAGVEDFVMQMRTFYRTGVEYHEPGLRNAVIDDKSH